MNLITLGNASLQVIATGLVAAGAIQIVEKHDILGGITLMVFGLIAYIVYEKFPVDNSGK